MCGDEVCFCFSGYDGGRTLDFCLFVIKEDVKFDKKMQNQNSKL